MKRITVKELMSALAAFNEEDELDFIEEVGPGKSINADGVLVIEFPYTFEEGMTGYKLVVLKKDE